MGRTGDSNPNLLPRPQRIAWIIGIALTLNALVIAANVYGPHSNTASGPAPDPCQFIPSSAPKLVGGGTALQQAPRTGTLKVNKQYSKSCSFQGAGQGWLLVETGPVAQTDYQHWKASAQSLSASGIKNAMVDGQGVFVLYNGYLVRVGSSLHDPSIEVAALQEALAHLG